MVPAFLEKLRTTCPKICVLEFYPEDPDECPDQAGCQPTDQCRSILRSFSNLRWFSSTTYILDSTTFEIIGNLPHLEIRGVRGYYMENPLLDEHLPVPETWFPALKTLRLYDVHPQDVETLWSHPPTVKGITSARVQIDPTIAPDPSDDPTDGNSWIESFVTALLHLSPGIQDLIFYVGDEDDTMFEMSQGARDGLRNLGLKNLTIKLNNTYGIYVALDYDM